MLNDSLETKCKVLSNGSLSGYLSYDVLIRDNAVNSSYITIRLCNYSPQNVSYIARNSAGDVATVMFTAKITNGTLEFSNAYILVFGLSSSTAANVPSILKIIGYK